MTPKCAASVRAAAGGRDISAKKLQAIEDAVSEQMRELARQDRTRWLSLSRDQQMTEAMTAAMERAQAEAKLKEYRAGLQVLRAAEVEAGVQRLQGLGAGLTRSQSYIAWLQNLNNTITGARDMAVSHLKALLDAGTSTEGVGLGRKLGIKIFDLDNPGMTADIVREIWRLADGHTGNAAAKKAAQAWLSTIEAMRLRFNAAGGAVGKLGYGYLSQTHDAVRLVQAGAKTWAAKVLPLLDREQYVNPDGSLMGQADMLNMLEGAHLTLTTGAANKRTPGQFDGTGARANRGADHRVLHFRDGDSWMAYMSEFGQGSLYDAMIGHVGRMARDMTLIERMGPNPEATHRVQTDLAANADNQQGRARELLDGRAVGSTPEAYWALVKGDTGTPENRWLAQIGSDARNIQTAAKITWGPFAAMADVGTVLQTLHFNRLPYFDYLKSYAAQLRKDHRDTLLAHGHVTESLVSHLNRWTGDNVTHSLTGRVTNAVMKLSQMNAWTDAGRRAFADLMMRNYSTKIGQAWGQLDEWDRYLMERKGLTEQDWEIISSSAKGSMFLSPQTIMDTGHPMAAQVADKWNGYVSDETQFAVVNPDLATRAMVTGGGVRAGTPTGEAWRTVAQFKSFPMAMLTRHWRRVLETPQGLEGAPAGFGDGGTVNKVALLAALAVTTTMMGAIQTQSRAILSGKDPIDMDPSTEEGRKFLAKSFAAGGGAGFLADVLMAPTEDSNFAGFGAKLGMFGPVPGAVGGLVDVAKSNHKAATATRWVSDQLPFVDMWQTRAAYEHWFLHNAQEAMNPGYLSRMKQRAYRDWGQRYWWEPGETLPDRAPGSD